MNRKYVAYYAFLSLLTFGIALHTVFIGSTHIDYGKRISSLENQKRQMAARVGRVEQQTAQFLSMTQLNQDAVAQGFVAIQNIVRVDTSTVVASR
ncbi:hypothetical protein H3C66_05875 [Patescibacteria group bacterium]|nr:hypothetical protein [Patescibacteria group bacterium]